MILLRKHKSISKAIISLNSSHSGGNFDVLNFSVHQNSKKWIYVLKINGDFEKSWHVHVNFCCAQPKIKPLRVAI